MAQSQIKDSRERVLVVSSGTVIRVCLTLLAIVVIYLIRDIVALFCAALFLAALIDPFADFFEDHKVPRGLAVLLVYIVGIVALASAIVLLLPPVLSELKTVSTIFAPLLPQVFGQNADLSVILQGSVTESVTKFINTLRGSGISAAVPQLLAIGSTAFGAIAALLVVLILAFYLVSEKEALVKALSSVTPDDYQSFVSQAAMKIRVRLGAWLRGELMLMTSIFLLTYIALSLIGIPYAIVLALLAGLFEIIPFVGPLLAGIPSVILAFAISPILGVVTILAYILIQVLEGNVLVPKIMQRATGLNPIITLLVVLIGLRLGGIVGAILSIPLANAAAVFIQEVYRERKSHLA
ncbi:MAG: AI-2E family transporter [Patescibacteria group bacterium]|jgi:predicted PurR-regulated permease PerM